MHDIGLLVLVTNTRMHGQRHAHSKDFTVESHSLLSLLKRAHFDEGKLLLPATDPHILDTGPLLVLLKSRLLHRLLKKSREHFGVDRPTGGEISNVDAPCLKKRGLRVCV
jgi:hypothetical protein